MGEVITKGNVEGVVITPLKQIRDERGAVFHMLKADPAKGVGAFGEIYFSVVKAGVVKAWKCHKIMKQNFAVPVGEIKLVIYDTRTDSKTKGQVQEIVVGVDHYGLVQIPAGVWYGFQAVSSVDALITNCASHTHDPDEVERVDQNSPLIPYKWNC